MEPKPFLCSERELRTIKHLLNTISRPFPQYLEADLKFLLLQEKDFIRLHLSLFYPFSPVELSQYRNKLIWGSTFYSTFVWDVPLHPIIFAEFGLSFNENISALCSSENLVSQYVSLFKSHPSTQNNKPLPLHLIGELENRFASRTAQYSKKPFYPDFAGEMHADSVLTAWNIYYYQEETITIQTLKELLNRYGLLTAFSKAIWEELLFWYMTPARLDSIMAEL